MPLSWNEIRQRAIVFSKDWYEKYVPNNSCLFMEEATLFRGSSNMAQDIEKQQPHE